MKLVLLFAILYILLPLDAARACEIPVAGISTSLAAYEKHISSETEDNTGIYIEAYSLLNGIDSDLVRAVIYGESSGQADAVNYNKNGTHDSGLMQINSFNYEWLSTELGITDFYDPEQNIKAGCYMLGLLSRKYDSQNRILMAYNMGEKQTRKLWRKGIRSSEYSRKVMKKFYELKEGKK